MSSLNTSKISCCCQCSHIDTKSSPPTTAGEPEPLHSPHSASTSSQPQHTSGQSIQMCSHLLFPSCHQGQAQLQRHPRPKTFIPVTGADPVPVPYTPLTFCSCHPCDVKRGIPWTKNGFCLVGLGYWCSSRRDNLFCSPDHSLAFPLTGSSSMWYVLILFRQKSKEKKKKIKSVVLPETLNCREETLDRQPPLQGMGNEKDLPDKQWHLKVLPNFRSCRGNKLQYSKGRVWHPQSCPAQDPNIQKTVATSKFTSGATTPHFLCIIFTTLCVNWGLQHTDPHMQRHGWARRKNLHTGFHPSCWG